MAPPRLIGARTTALIYARMATIASASGGRCTVHEDSGLTSHSRGQPLKYLRIASSASDAGRETVLLTGGLHCREWAPPDALLQLAEYLIEAYNNDTALDLPAIAGSAYTTGAGGAPGPTATFDLPAHRISNNEVERVLDKLVIYIAPLVNPDGRDYTMAPLGGPPGGPFRPRDWRKNDPPANGTDPNPPPARGVNLNGNFPVPKATAAPAHPTHWENLQRYYGAAGLASAGISNDPTDWQEYGGDTDASATETRFVQWLVTNKRIRFFMDVHSAAHLVSHPWAMEKNGADATMRFTTTAWDSTPGPPHTSPAAHPTGRDGVAGDVYYEYVPDDPPYRLRNAHRTVAASMRNAILSSAGADPVARERSIYNDFRRFGAPDFGHPGPGPVEGSIAELIYAAPASGMDWVFSRQFTDATLAPTYAFAFECGDAEEGGFWPDYPTQFGKIEREVVIGCMELLKFAAAWRRAGASSCYVATATYGSSFHPEIQYVVQVRERVLRPTRAGRRFLGAVAAIYDRVGPPAARWLTRHPTARGIAHRAVVEPLFRAIRVCDDQTRHIESPERRAAMFSAMLTTLILLGLGAAVAVLVLLGWMVTRV